MISSFILFIFSSFLIQGALAQDVVLDEISVSGNKEGRTFSETPESVTILPPTRINRGDQSNSLEVLNAQSNVQVSRNAETFSIRGINSAGVTGFQKDNLASIFVDDVFQTDLAIRAGSFETWDMSTLEIYRGPQSTSQGVNSLAGAIILNHFAPVETNEAALKLGYGSFNRREVGAMVNKSTLNNKLATRVSFNKDMNDGFIENKTRNNDKWGRQDKGHLVLDFKYTFDDKSTLRFNNKFLKNEYGGNYTLVTKPRNFNTFENEDDFSTANNQQNSLQYNRELSSQLSNKTTLAFTKGFQNSRSDADGTPAPTLGRRREFYSDQFISVENVLKYNSSRYKNALGIHAHKYRSFDSFDFNAYFTPSVIFNATQESDKTRDTYAIFDSLLLNLDKNHSLNFGLRYEFVHNTFGNKIFTPATGNAGADAYLGARNGNYTGEQDTQTLLPKLGYIYQVNKHTWGVTYTQGYRIGGLSINRSRSTSVEYDPEKTNNYEASWKFNGENLKTQANIFYTDWQDQQVTVRLTQSDPYDTQVQNAANSELYGGELESTYDWKNGETLRLGVGHVRTRFKNFKTPSVSYTGNEFPEAPRWTAQAAWAHMFTDTFMSNLTFRHVGEAYTVAENTRHAPDQFYLDLNLQYTAETYVWEFNARNLLDNVYVLNKNPVYARNDLLYRRTNRPRELGTRITWFW